MSGHTRLMGALSLEVRIPYGEIENRGSTFIHDLSRYDESRSRDNAAWLSQSDTAYATTRSAVNADVFDRLIHILRIFDLPDVARIIYWSVRANRASAFALQNGFTLQVTDEHDLRTMEHVLFIQYAGREAIAVVEHTMASPEANAARRANILATMGIPGTDLGVPVLWPQTEFGPAISPTVEPEAALARVRRLKFRK